MFSSIKSMLNVMGGWGAYNVFVFRVDSMSTHVLFGNERKTHPCSICSYHMMKLRVGKQPLSSFQFGPLINCRKALELYVEWSSRALIDTKDKGKDLNKQNFWANLTSEWTFTGCARKREPRAFLGELRSLSRIFLRFHAEKWFSVSPSITGRLSLFFHSQSSSERWIV